MSVTGDIATIGGLGIKLESSPDGTAFTEIGNINSISGPGIKAGVREIKHLASEFVKKRKTLADPGELTIEMDYNKTGHSGLVAKISDTTTEMQDGDHYKITFPDDDSGTAGGNVSFTAFVSEVDPGGMEPGSTVTMSVTLTLTSMPVFA